jgi:hypothetical protein
VFSRIRAQAFKPNIIGSAFRKTGLFLYSPDEVMDTLYEEEEEKEKALPTYFNMNITPRKILKLEAYGEKLYRMV